MYRYDLIDLKNDGDGVIDRNSNFKSCIFLNDIKDDGKLLVVGSEVAPPKGLYRIYNHKEDEELNVVDESTAYK